MYPTTDDTPCDLSKMAESHTCDSSPPHRAMSSIMGTDTTAVSADPQSWEKKQVTTIRSSDPIQSVTFDTSSKTILKRADSHSSLRETQQVRRHSKLLNRSRSTPSLKHKLSTQFMHPTIVHRPDLRVRASILSINSQIVSDGQPSDPLSPAVTVTTSNINSGNTSPNRKKSSTRTSVASSVLDGVLQRAKSLSILRSTQDRTSYDHEDDQVTAIIIPCK
jgi:hypothetical protein